MKRKQSAVPAGSLGGASDHLANSTQFSTLIDFPGWLAGPVTTHVHLLISDLSADLWKTLRLRLTGKFALSHRLGHFTVLLDIDMPGVVLCCCVLAAHALYHCPSSQPVSSPARRLLLRRHTQANQCWSDAHASPHACQPPSICTHSHGRGKK